MGLFADLIGTTKAVFQIAIGGVKLGNSTGNLTVKDNANADADITVKKVFLSGNELEINSDAAGSAADWKYTLKRPAAGMTAAVELTLPANDGSPNQVMATDGSGVLSFVTAAVTTQNISVDETALSFDTSSPVAMFSLPVGAVIDLVRIILDTPFNGTAPTLSIGVAGTVSKYMATTQVNLKGTAKDVYEVKPAEAAITGSPEAVIATYVADTSSAGAARIEVHYTIPS